MGLRQRGSVIGNYVTASNTSASGMWTGKEAYTLQKKGTWQLPPTFSIAAGAANVNEGASINFTMTTTGIANGTVIPYTASGANITILDSANSSLSGNFVIQNGSNTISFSANLDLTTEGNEVLQITAAGATANVTINDTSTTPVTTDAQFPYTTLLLNGQGTNNSQNNTFLDSSTNNFSITRNGNSTQGTFSPYGGNWSTSFSDSAGDYLEISSSTAFALGTGDFTIEAWIYPFSYGGSVAGTAIFGTSGGAATGYSLNLGESQDRMRILSNASGTWADNLVVSAGGGAPLHAWSHIAWVRSGNSMTIYKNGTSVATMSGVSGYNFTSPNNKGYIGFWWDGGTTRYFNGYISNLRVVKGTALYTTTFTPSTTPLTAVANTSLLTCQDNRFIDESPNNFTITRYIAPKIQKFNPFSPVITTPTTYSGYFDGTGDYLTVPSTDVFAFGTGAYTIEAWVYVTSRSTEGSIWATGAQNNNFLITTGGLLRLYNGTSYTGTTVIPLNTWAHVVVVRTSTATNGTQLFVNGVSDLVFTDTTNQTSATTGIIGVNNPASNQYFFGNISNLRVVKGTAVYTSNFTPSTTPLTAISGTSLLTCQSPTFIDNSTNTFAITANGNSQPTTVNPFGVTNTSSEYSTTTFGGSAYFDGSGDYLEAASNAAFALPGDFTYECWFNSDNTGTGSMFMEVPVNNGLQLYYNGSQLFVSAYAITSLISYTYTMPISTWVHIALVRKGTASNNVVLYINGTSVATASYNSEFPQGPFRIGGTSYYFKGYISNCRLVKGTAVYQSNFAPPIAPVTAVANTQLLCNFTNAGVIDNAMMTNLETIADAKISTTQSKFGGTSMYFDGTGDYLSIPSSTSLNCGTGNFTFECWVYISSRTLNYPAIFSNNNGSYSAGAIALTNSNADNGAYVDRFVLAVYDIATPTLVASSTNSLNTWYHLALVRNGTSLVMYRDGISVASTTISAAAIFDWGKLGCRIGGGNWDDAQSYFNGYIDDLRVTKGYARYTSNFTPPTNQLAGK